MTEQKPSFLGKSVEDLLMHDMANYVQAIMGYLDLVLRVGKLDEKEKGYITKALSQAKKLTLLLNAGTMIRGFQSQKPEPQPIAIGSLLRERGVECAGEDTILADVSLLDAIDNVLDVCACNSDTPKMEITRENDCYRISFTCNHSVPDDDALAMQYFTRHKTEHDPIGVGLSIARAVVEGAGGRLEVQPSPFKVVLEVPEPFRQPL
ncbi:MAG: histidine kinase [Methermicoccaceae archaeon]